jgi:hypothetical protein
MALIQRSRTSFDRWCGLAPGYRKPGVVTSCCFPSPAQDLSSKRYARVRRSGLADFREIEAARKELRRMIAMAVLPAQNFNPFDRVKLSTWQPKNLSLEAVVEWVIIAHSTARVSKVCTIGEARRSQ